MNIHVVNFLLMEIRLWSVALEQAPVDAADPDDAVILVPFYLQVTLREAVKGVVVRDVAVVWDVVRRVYVLLGALQANQICNLLQHGVLELPLGQRPHFEASYPAEQPETFNLLTYKFYALLGVEEP